MKNKNCILCRKELEDENKDLCDSCHEIMKTKYPDKNKLKEVIKWHKENLKKTEE